jgi:hypothetical protein
MRIGMLRTQFIFVQGKEARLPDEDGVLHLRAAPFEIQFSDNWDHVLLSASTAGTMAKEMSLEKRPIVFCGAGAAYGKGNLFLAEKAKLVRWKDNAFEDALGEAEFKRWDNSLKQTIGHSNVAVIYVPVQAVGTHAKEGNGPYTFYVNRILRIDGGPLVLNFKKPDRPIRKTSFRNQRKMTLVVMLLSQIRGRIFGKIDWRIVRIKFDLK